MEEPEKSRVNKVNVKKAQITPTDGNNSSSEESDIEFQRPIPNQTNNYPRKSKNDNGGGSSVTSRGSPQPQPPSSSSNQQSQFELENGSTHHREFSISVEDLNLNLPALNSTQVTRFDFAFSSIVFALHFSDLLTDFILIGWHYIDVQIWESVLTLALVLLGAGGILNQYSISEQDRLDRLFRHGRRVRLLTNCFPPLGIIISSYHCALAAWKARRDQIICVQYFAIEEFSQGVARIQSFFQSAPQASLQLIIFLDNVHEISFEKGAFTIISVIFSLIVMTVANLPARSEPGVNEVRKALYSPSSRLFVALRMFSSFASRAMAIGLLFLGLKCLFQKSWILIGVGILICPRLLFTIVDYSYHARLVRKSRLAATTGRLSLCGTLAGYVATIFFQMAEPVWIFWYIWSETGIFVIFGSIVGETQLGSSNFLAQLFSSTNETLPIGGHRDDPNGQGQGQDEYPCLPTLFNIFYTTTFIVLFLGIPICIPFLRANFKRSQLKRLEDAMAAAKNYTETQQQLRVRTANSVL